MKTHRGSLLRSWLLCGLLSAASAGCTLYIDLGDDDEPSAGPGSGSGGGGYVPPAPGDPTRTPEPQPAPSVPSVRLDGFDTADHGNAGGVHGCVAPYGYAHYEHPVTGAAQLHVVGIYEAANATGTDRREGKVDVRVTRPGPSVLMLSSYEPTTWNVIVEPGAYVERVILSGYHAQSVSAPEGTPIESYNAYGEGGQYIGIGYDWPSHDTRHLVEVAQGLTGLTLTSFRGCYTSSSFEIDTPAEIRPPHPVSGKAELTLPAGCEHLAGESAYCLSRSGGTPVVIGMDSGSTCRNEAIGSATSPDTSSLGWYGDYAYGCIYERGLARISLIDGSVDVAPIACEAVTVDAAGHLLVMPFSTSDFPQLSLFSVLRFASFDDAARLQIAEVLPVEPYATRMATDGGRGYFAWHATSTIEVADLATGALQSLALEGYDDWILGLDAVGDRLFVLGSWTEPGVRVFDATTGAQKNIIAPEFLGEGLACAAGAL
jgi:hypothetical protein